jgi:hypothetical protein
VREIKVLVPDELVASCDRIFVGFIGEGYTWTRAIIVKDRLHGPTPNDKPVDGDSVFHAVEDAVLPITKHIKHGGWTINVTPPEDIDDFEIDTVHLGVTVEQRQPIKEVQLIIKSADSEESSNGQ